MIVSDSQVMSALEWLADTTIPAEARYQLTMSENKAKGIWSAAFLEAHGTVAEREAMATCNLKYIDAQIEFATAQRDWEQCRAKTREAEMVIEIWRTENANARAAERVR